MSKELRTHGVQPAIDSSATTSLANPDDFARFFNEGVPDGCHLYIRQKHEAGTLLGARLAQMECGESGYVTASGISAIGALFLHHARPGDYIVVSSSLYGGSRDACHFWRDHAGIRFAPVDIRDSTAVERVCKNRRPKMLFMESVSNPDLVVAPIAALSLIAREYNIPLVVDNTFSPLAISPLRLGADIVVHSLTKYVSGDSQAIAGGIVGSKKLLTEMMHMKTGTLTMYGSVLDPVVAGRLLLHMDHLPLRVNEALRRAKLLAALAKKYGIMVSAAPESAVISFIFDSYKQSRKFMKAIQGAPHIELAVSLGSSHTYITPFGAPKRYAPVWNAPLPFAPIPEGLVRIAVGYAGETEILMNAFSIALCAATHHGHSSSR